MPQDLIQNNTDPPLRDLDRNVSVQCFFAPANLELDHTSTDVRQEIGSLNSGTYDITPTIETNQTRTGVVNFKKRTHMNGLMMKVVGDFNEITPLNNGLARITDTNVEFSLTSDLYTITAVGLTNKGFLSSLTLGTLTNLAQGDYFKLHFDRSDSPFFTGYVTRVDPAGWINLLEELDTDDVDLAIAGRKVVNWVGRYTSGAINEYSLFNRISGDDAMILYHELPKGEFVNSKESTPNKDIMRQRLEFDGTAVPYVRPQDGRRVGQILIETAYPSGAP